MSAKKLVFNMEYKTFGCGGSCGTCDCDHEDKLLLDADELEDEEKKDKKDEDVLGDLEDDEDDLSDLGEIKDTDDIEEVPLDEVEEDSDWDEKKDDRI
jgi:hypothetical protein